MRRSAANWRNWASGWSTVRPRAWPKMQRRHPPAEGPVPAPAPVAGPPSAGRLPLWVWLAAATAVLLAAWWLTR
jgi:hypothetical protein